MPVVDCIITAAGLSSRMGKWKMMLPWHAGTILDASIKNALQFCNRVILVSGYRATEIHNRYANQPNIIITYNPDYAQGLFTSIKVGAAAVNSGHCFITHGDMPELNNDIFRKIWALRNDNALIPCYQASPAILYYFPKNACCRPSHNRMSAICVRHCCAENIILLK